MAALSSGICIPSNVTSKDCVCIFAFGHNSFGQIKLNGIPKINRPTLIKERLGDGSSQDIHGTWRFTLFAREDRVLVLGSVEPSEKHQVKTVKLPWTMKKILLSPNQSQLVGLTSENRLALSEETNLTSRLTMHNNSTKYEAIWRTHDGVLAQESFDHYCMLAFLGSISSVQFPLDKGAVVTHVSCGHCHSLMLTADRSVYAYGIGTRGELGLGDLEGSKVPVQLEALGGLRVAQLSCGGWHNLALTESGDVYSWGWNESGQLGLETDMQVISTPTLLPLQLRCEGLEFKKVSCGSRHSCALTRDGCVYTWGWGEYGQLGHGDLTSRSQPHALDISAVGKVSDVIAGHWNTFLITELE